jgi:type IV pilus assembly protein PilC
VPEFSCRVATATGEVFEKTYVAGDEAGLRRDLEGQDLLVLDLRRRNLLVQQIGRSLRLRGVVSAREFLFFNQELRALLRAGLPIVPSLDIMLERRKNKTFRRALIDVRDRVKSGEALSDAFAAQGDMFPRLYSTSLASGERSGELVAVLERFITYTRNMLAVRRKVVSAMIYPLILLVLSFALILLMVFFIIPKFNVFLSDFGTELPWITRVIVGVALFCQTHWRLLGTLAVGSVVGLMAWRRSDGGRVLLDRIKLRIPLVGGIIHDYAQNRFTRTLGTLQAGGIPLVTSLELSARAVGNAVFERELLGVANKVREGQALWESLDQTMLLSDITIQMVKVGESTGALDEMLQNSSDFTDEEIDARLTRVVAMIEPIMLVFMALVVGVMLLSVYYPMIQLYGQSKF